MRKISLIVCLFALSLAMSAQDGKILSELTAILERSQVVAHYSYSDPAGAKLGEGVATVQGRKYCVSEGKAMFISNGATLWSVFSDRKEIYIENAGGSNDLFSNLPEVLKTVEGLTWNGKDISFTMDFPGTGKIACKATVQELPWNNDAKFTVSEDILGSKDWIVTDLR